MEPLALLLAASLSVSVSNAQRVITVNLKAWRKKWVSNTKHYLVFVAKAFAQLLQKYQETIAFLALYNTLLLSIATWLYQSLVRKYDNLTVIFIGKEELKTEKSISLRWHPYSLVLFLGWYMPSWILLSRGNWLQVFTSMPSWFLQKSFSRSICAGLQCVFLWSFLRWAGSGKSKSLSKGR